MIRRILTLTLLVTGLASQDLRQLPDWAVKAVWAVGSEPDPVEADAWVLLQRTEVAYAGDGEIRMRRFRVVKVLSDRGISERVFALWGLGGKASKVKRLRGWNLRPDGNLEKLDTDSAVTVDGDAEGEITTSVLTTARLPRVVKGSLLAFESLESIVHPMGPTVVLGILEKHPVRQWELEAVTAGGWFTNLSDVAVRLDARHLAPWASSPEIVPGKSIRAAHLPGAPTQEGAAPNPRNAFPTVLVRFQDPALKVSPSTATWDELARWVDSEYQQRFRASGIVAKGNRTPKAFLEAVHQWMTRELTYKQVYVTPQRGWMPDPGPEVVRHRYGDCKDLTCCLLSEAKGFGLEVHPVMAMIGHGFIEPGEQPSFSSFDHVISAIRLTEGLGYPAEVQTPQGRFLLADPTSRLTPLGWLPAVHRGRRVMICTPTGALWVTIPATAVQMPASRISLRAEVNAVREAQGDLTIEETANHLGLREAARGAGAQGLREALMPFLDLPPTAKLEVQSFGDPLELTKPFNVKVSVSRPGALRREGRDEVLVDWGVPPLPRRIQRPGTPRRLPVESLRQGQLELEAVYQLPFGVKPLLPRLDLETAFRTLHWTAEATTDQGHPAVHLHCVQTFQPTYFDFPDRATGAQAWKKDRSAMIRLRLDGLAFARDP